MSVVRIPVQVADGDLHVMVEGDGEPLLALHGLLGLGAAVASQVPDGFRVATYDQRGHGSGPRPQHADGYAIERFAADAAAVLDALAAQDGPRWARPTVLGNSMGAAVALRLVMDEPRRAARLVLVGPAFGDSPIAVMDQFLAIADGLDKHGIDGWVPIFRAGMIEGGLPEPATRWLDDWVGNHDGPALAAVVRAAAHWVPFPDLDRVDRLPVPVLVVSWPGDPIHPTALAERVVALTGAATGQLTDVAEVLADPAVVARCLRPLLQPAR